MAFLDNSITQLKSLIHLFSSSDSAGNLNDLEESTAVIDVSAKDVPNFLEISPKKQSVIVHILNDRCKDIEEVLCKDLHLVKSDIQNGAIYKPEDGSVTVTLYTSTNKLHIQGKNIYTWLDTFVYFCEQLEITHKKIISTQPISSTPIKCSQHIQEDNSLLHSTSDINITFENKEQLDHSDRVCQYEGKSREELINIIEDLKINLEQCKANTMTRDVAIQTIHIVNVNTKCQTSDVSSNTSVSVCDNTKVNNSCQTFSPSTVGTAVQTTPIPAPRKITSTVGTATQTTPIPAPRTVIQKPKPVPMKRKSKNIYLIEECPNQSTTVSENHVSTPSHFDNGKKQQKAKQTLIIGSSLLKGIKTRGLHNTDVRTIRGARIERITDEIMKTDISTYKNIILQVGGNDFAQHGNLKLFEEDYESLLYATRASANKESNIIVSGLLSRSDVCVRDANIVLQNLCDYLGLIFIPQYETFSESAFMYYARDGIHLNRRGTTTFLKNINRVIGILKSMSRHCDNCGEQNHETEQCRYRIKLKCFHCGLFGHKRRLCELE